MKVEGLNRDVTNYKIKIPNPALRYRYWHIHLARSAL
ncbi:hypothetical protein SLEP1_g8873 [Rubroshorea leprosula]|uniref:Uncharacterized protein n=1 Tax=Rubroshorea leprosula TaxID=152421 RepID=A0AAV5IB18_9ROSI|nr:hypothetical protein SLEP1_g8873 [Rubroshorea leprosula]